MSDVGKRSVCKSSWSELTNESSENSAWGREVLKNVEKEHQVWIPNIRKWTVEVDDSQLGHISSQFVTYC
jgi:hypothetical protein